MYVYSIYLYMREEATIKMTCMYVSVFVCMYIHTCVCVCVCEECLMRVTSVGVYLCTRMYV